MGASISTIERAKFTIGMWSFGRKYMRIHANPQTVHPDAPSPWINRNNKNGTGAAHAIANDASVYRVSAHDSEKVGVCESQRYKDARINMKTVSFY